jgi:hypothetical protein
MIAEINAGRVHDFSFRWCAERVLTEPLDPRQESLQIGFKMLSRRLIGKGAVGATGPSFGNFDRTLSAPDAARRGLWRSLTFRPSR